MNNEFAHVSPCDLRASARKLGALCVEQFVMPLAHHEALPNEVTRGERTRGSAPALSSLRDCAPICVGARESSLRQRARQRAAWGIGGRDDPIRRMRLEMSC
jgi:hypothetical protein